MIDERLLVEALVEANNYIAEYGDEQHLFSNRVNRRIERLIDRERHPLYFRLKNVAAIVLFALVIGGTILLCSSETARASVRAWFSGIFEGSFLYRGTADSDIDIKKYSIRDIIPSGYDYSEDDSYREDEEVCEAYLDPDGYYFYLNVFRPVDGEVVQLHPTNNDICSNIAVGNYVVDYYYAPDGKANSYVWQNDQGVLFYLGGHIDEKTLYSLAETFLMKYE